MTDQPPYDNCDDCGQDYPLERDKDVMVLFIRDALCNHVEAICPHCGGQTRIFISGETLIWILQEAKLTLRLVPEADEEMRKRVHEMYNEPIPYLPVEPVEPPHWMLRELYDQLREYEQDN